MMRIDTLCFSLFGILVRATSAAACVLLLSMAASAAADPDLVPPPDDAPPATKPADSSSLDKALLEGLDNELLEGAGDTKGRTAPQKPSAASDAADAEMIDDMQPGEHDDPLVHISQEMRMVEEFLPQQSRRPHAEQLQRRIVDDLARLIEQAESQRAQKSPSSQQQKAKSVAERKQVQQPKQTQGNAGKDSNQPAKDSSTRLSNAEAARPDPELFKRMMKDTWGHLPARDREQMLQTTPDKFLPQYELMIEKYYKRLAEEPQSP
ncbi:MAG: hypothetical protein WD845_04755 [Pirellulales bacterium]